MTSTNAGLGNERPDALPCTEWAALLVIAAAIAIIHLLTNGRYGFHRDELQFLSDARHMDWGFVAYRMLAWMYLIPLAMFFFAKGRGYYMAAAYPMLLAMGAAVGERWIASLPRWGRRTVAGVFFTGLATCGAYIFAVILPLQSSGPLRDFALKRNGDLREEIGWEELVSTVAQIRDSLTPEQRAHLGITTGNYGEYGAIDILGRAYGLPEPIGTTNSEWLRGYPAQPPTTIIALGIRPEEADKIFTGCRLAGHNGNSEGIHNEELDDHPFIFVCGPPRKPWAEVWKEHKDFG